MKMIKLFLVVLSLLFSVSALADITDIYRYIDEEDIVHFTEAHTDSRFKKFTSISTVNKTIHSVNSWFSLYGKSSECSPDKSPAEFISLCGNDWKCKVNEDVVKNGKPTVVTIIYDLEKSKSKVVFFKNRELCQKEAKYRKQKEAAEYKKLERYR